MVDTQCKLQCLTLGIYFPFIHHLYMYLHLIFTKNAFTFYSAMSFLL